MASYARRAWPERVPTWGEEAVVSAMGERFLILEETADALDVIDPELAVQFRLVNGLPGPDERSESLGARPPEPSTTPPKPHEIRMDVGADQITSDCSCGTWTSAVDGDDIDTMVIQIRQHLGSVHASSEDGILAAGPPTGAQTQVG